MIIAYILSAALFAAVANFFFRRNLEKGGTSRAFLSLYFAVSFVLATVLAPELFNAKFSLLMIVLGALCGFLNYIMMGLTAKSLETGPPGLTFTFQNASCLIPGLLLWIIFGSRFGFFMTPWLIVGFVLILSGLYVSARAFSNSEQKTSSTLNKWLAFAVSMLAVQGLILSIFQWRVLLFACSENPHWLLPWSCLKEDDIWFMPAFFLIPSILQWVEFIKNEKRKPIPTEWVNGVTAGVLNALGMLLLLLSTKTESSLNKGMLFPIFTISVILFCNLWGMKIYKEKVNWVGIILCVIGVAIGLI